MEIVRDIVDQFARWYLGGTFRQRTDAANWCRHVYWEHKKAADAHANWSMDNGDSSPGAQREVADLPCKIQEAKHILICFDGARRGSGLGAAAWVLWMRDKGGHFEKLSHGGKILEDNTAMAAEREAIRMGVQCLSKLFPIKMDHFDFVINNSGSAAQYKIDATILRISRYKIAPSLNQNWQQPSTTSSQILCLGYMPRPRMTILPGHQLRCAMCQGRREVPLHGRPARFVLSRCLLMVLLWVRHSPCLVGRPLCLRTLNRRENDELMFFGLLARRIQ